MEFTHYTGSYIMDNTIQLISNDRKPLQSYTNIYIRSETNKSSWPANTIYFGVGETEKSFKQRLSDGYSKKIQELKMKNSDIELVAWFPNVQTRFDGKTDHDVIIHKFLDTIPNIHRISKKSEEFVAVGYTLEEIVNLIRDKFFSGERNAVRSELILSKPQENFLNKIGSNSFDSFLLWAKCRFGKSIAVLSHVAEHHYNTTLIVSRVKSAKQSWFADLAKFKPFEYMISIDMGDPEWDEHYNRVDHSKYQVVLFSTVQGLVNKLEQLPDIDLIVFDECHIGRTAQQYKSLKFSKKLQSVPELVISGTAFKDVYEYDEQNRFIYSYYDEQLDNNLGYNVPLRPSMEVILAKYNSNIYNSAFPDSPDAMKNIFVTDNNTKEFTNEFLVADFINMYFVANKSLSVANQLLGKAKHVYITLPSIDACHAFAKLISRTRFAAIVVTSDTDADYQTINKHIAENTHTITITQQANVLGVTAPWDTILNCREGKSIEQWTQFAFRGGSTSSDWYVIDFSPERALQAMRQTYALAVDTNPELAEYEFTDFVNIMYWEDGFTSLNKDDVAKMLANDLTNASSLISGLVHTIDLAVLKNINFETFDVGNDDSIHTTVILNDNGTSGESNKKKSSPAKQKDASDEQSLAQKIKTAKAYLARTGMVIYNELMDGNTVNNIDAILDSKYYELCTLDYTGLIKTLLDANVFNRIHFAYRLTNVIDDIKKGIIEDSTDALYKLSISTGKHKTIPPELMYEFAKKVKATDTVLIIGDPCGYHTKYLIEKVGVVPSNITVWDSEYRHQGLVSIISKDVDIIDSMDDLLMKRNFDVVIENPPYQNDTVLAGQKQGGFFYKFVEAGIEVLKPNGKLMVICPNSIFGAGGYGSKAFKVSRITKKMSFTHIWPTVNKHFDVGINILAFIAEKNTLKPDVEIIGTNDTVQIDGSLPVPFFVHKNAFSIIKKCFNTGSDTIPFRDDMSTVETPDSYVIRVNGGQWKLWSKLYVGINSGTKNNQQGGIIDAADVPGYQSAIQSELWEYIYKFFGTEKGTSPTTVMKRMPKMADMTKSYSNQEWYEAFNITDEEQQEIKKFLKEYK